MEISVPNTFLFYLCCDPKVLSQLELPVEKMLQKNPADSVSKVFSFGENIYNPKSK